jgi:hypothetical protein
MAVAIGRVLATPASSQDANPGVASRSTGVWQAPKRRENDDCRLVSGPWLAMQCVLDCWKAAEATCHGSSPR